MSSTKLYYCMQVNKGTHCSFNEDVDNRFQCQTCHDYERAEAADKAKAYAKKPDLGYDCLHDDGDPLHGR